MAHSPEIETLDQLLGGEMSLSIIRQLYDSDECFIRGTLRLLQNEDVRLFDQSHSPVPRWRWRPLFEGNEVFAALHAFTLDVTKAGVAKIS